MAPPCKKARTPPPCQQSLPDEIIEDIFARMPAKSVLRCRCLSRAWAAALSSDAFIDKHLDLANRRREEVPTLCFLPASAAASTVYAWSPEHGKGVFMPLMAVPHNTRNGSLAAVTRPCRGLLLLRAVDARLYYLCNPSMGQITALPDGRMAGDRHPRRDYASFGLGYDDRARTHKVVRLLYHDGEPAGCDIYDVGANSSTGHWRPAASGGVPPDHVRMNQMGVFVHGHVHWITMRYSEGDAIVSFSIAAEEFGYVAPPPGAAVAGFKLTELAGHLCLFSAPHCPKSPLKRIDIWLLTDYAATAWGKHWHIDLTKLPPPPPEVGGDFMSNGVAPVALVDGGRRIVFISDEYQVATFCLATGTLVELVQGFRGRGGHGGGSVQLLAPYAESLVPAGRPFEDTLFSPAAPRALSVALRRMPARGLGRLKLVCRSWRAMIERDRFATWHNACARAKAATCTTPLPVVFMDPFGSTVPIPHEFVDPDSSPVVSLESCSSSAGSGPGARRRGSNSPLSTSRVVCRRPCHGLLLLSHKDGNCHALCNPVTRQVRSLRLLGDDDGHGCAGLGYDQSREEHVLVCLSYASRCFETREYELECRVWHLRDLHPRTVASKLPIPVAVDVPPVHVGGRMYLPGEPRLAGTAAAADAAAAILAFDIGTEAFEIVPAPPSRLDVNGGDMMVLTELAGKLCAVHLSASTETMTVWGKSVVGWTTEHVIELEQWPEFSLRSTEVVVPMAADPRGGRILLDTGRALGYYDARSRSLETVYSLESQRGDDDQHRAEDMSVIATVCEDSLFRPYDRKSRLW